MIAKTFARACHHSIIAQAIDGGRIRGELARVGMPRRLFDQEDEVDVARSHGQTGETASRRLTDTPWPPI